MKAIDKGLAQFDGLKARILGPPATSPSRQEFQRPVESFIAAQPGGVRIGEGSRPPGHRRLAYVPGDVNLWPSLSGGEIIDLLARLRGGVDRRRRDELIERFALDPRKKSRTYSKGNRQKVALVAALASNVDLLVLDEPTSGLDPLMESVFQACILEAAAAGTTVLLSSHILAEVERLCDRVTIIRDGRAVQHGTLAELRSMTRTSIIVQTRRPAVMIESIDGVHSPRLDGDRLRFEVDNTALDAALRHLADYGIESLVSQPPTLEELFLMHYGDNRHDSETAVHDNAVDE